MKYLLAIVFILYFLFLPTSVFAQNSVRISGFDVSRSPSAFLDSNGNPFQMLFGSTDLGTTKLGEFLLNEENFSDNGIVGCSVDLEPPINYIGTNSLVSPDGTLLLDVFFATRVNQHFSQEEVDELKKFLESGGIVYLHSSSSELGLYYNPVLNQLGVNISFGSRVQVPTLTRSTFPVDSEITTGPFGRGQLYIGPFSRIFSSGATAITEDIVNNEVNLVEANIGEGYISVSGSPLHPNIVARGENVQYLANLVALACPDSKVTILDAPSLKQGIYPYDGVEPSWENVEYDHGNSQNLWCGSTIAQCGCAMTSAAMVAAHHGVISVPDGEPLTPFTLNNYLNGNSRFGSSRIDTIGYFGGSLNWAYLGPFSENASSLNAGAKIEMESRQDYDPDVLRQLIDDGKPVPLRTTNSRGGTHWPLVIGYTDTDFIIHDPAYPDPTAGEHMTLASQEYTPQQSGSMIVYEKTNSDFSSLHFSVNESAHLLVADQFGRKLGYDQSTGQIFEEIPGGTYILEPALDDPTGQMPVPPPGSGRYSALILKPENGEYTVFTVGDDLQEIGVFGSTTDGTASNEIFISKESKVFYDDTGEEPFEVEVIPAEIPIDVRPFSSNIRVSNRIPVMVAILSTDSFDVNNIDEDTIRFGATGQEDSMWACLRRSFDVDRDGLQDKICIFDMWRTDMPRGTNLAVLSAQTNGGLSVRGEDTVRVVGRSF